jgi:tRNA(Ile)-lysidine synthase TilS/MesJ
MKQDLAILFSGGKDSVALYAFAALGKCHDIPSPRTIHLIHMSNGVSRFRKEPSRRIKTVKKLLAKQASPNQPLPESVFIDLDVTHLFQELWLDRYEALMPEYGGKNLVCVACKLAMHTRAVIFCHEHSVPNLLVGMAKKQSHLPEQSEPFMERMIAMSERFGIITRFPLYEALDDDETTVHFLKDHGLPAFGGGKSDCLFSRTLTTANVDHTASYIDDMMPSLIQYIEGRLDGKIKETALSFT